MIGLLAKAYRLRNGNSGNGRGREEIVFDSESGISREDQKEILQEIDGIATKSRISVTPEVFAVRAMKRGVLFPITVNVAAILALAIGAACLYFLYQRGETQIKREQPVAITAEGKLLEEVKRESEARLAQKNQEINSIQDRLAQIDRERQDLQANMDAKVGQREKELRASMAAELDAERQKLKGQGLSDQDIEKRLSELESRKNAESNRRLETYRAEAETERRKSEENLKALRVEFAANLEKANADRQQVLTDSQKREEELRRQLAEATHSLEARDSQAEKALSTLSAQKENEDLVSGQLIGLYETVKADIAMREYARAIQDLQAVRSFVNRQEVMVLPAMSRRREFDLFVVDSLTALSQGERDRTKTDTSSLIAAAAQVSEVRAQVNLADGMVSAGKLKEAEEAYAKALATIPEIRKSRAFILERERQTEAEKQARLSAGLAKAEAAFEAGRTADALLAYREALEYLPESQARLDKTVSNIAASGFDQGAQRTRQEQSRAAAGVLNQAKFMQGQGKREDALPLYFQILASYPLSSQAPEAVKGIEASVQGISAAASDRQKQRQADTTDQIAVLTQELQSLKEKYAALSGSDEGGGGKLSDDLRKAEEENKRLLARIDSLNADLEAANAGASGALPLQGDAQRLAALEKAYRRYASREDPVLTSKGEEGLVDTKAYLDSFLGSKSFSDSFPGLLNRIKRYDRGFQSAGRVNALHDVLDVVIMLSHLKTQSEREKLINGQLETYRGDPAMSDLLEQLKELMQ